jgi:hypothetical protein
MAFIEQQSPLLGRALSALAALHRELVQMQESPEFHSLTRCAFFDEEVDAINAHRGVAVRLQVGEGATLDDLSSQLRSANPADSDAKLRVALAVYSYMEGDFGKARSLLPTADEAAAVNGYSRELLGELKVLAGRSVDDATVKREDIKRRIDHDITVLLHPVRVAMCRELLDKISRKTFDLTLTAVILHDRLQTIERIVTDLAAAEKGESLQHNDAFVSEDDR